MEWLSQRLPAGCTIRRSGVWTEGQQLLTPNFFIAQTADAMSYWLDEAQNVPLVGLERVYGGVVVNQTITSETLTKAIDVFTTWDEQLTFQDAAPVYPLKIWLAEQLAPFLTLEDLVERLAAEARLPDLVVVLEQGLLLRAAPWAVELVYHLQQQGKTAQQFDRQLVADWQTISSKTASNTYLKWITNVPALHLFYFTILLRESVRHQPLNEGRWPVDLEVLWGMGEKGNEQTS